MTTYGAYDAGLPCKNSHCKSFGRPHPNCECYSNRMAKGGEVAPFCGQSRPHKPSCHYFAKGGSVDYALANLTVPMPSPEENVTGALAAMGAHKLLTKSHDPESFVRHAKRGHAQIKAAIQSLFEQGHGKVPDGDSESREKLKKYVEDGAVSRTLMDAQEPDGLAQSHPTENVLLNAAKGRVAQYLTNLKPQKNQPKLAYDSEPDDTEATRTFHKALGLANEPLSLLGHVKAGTMLPADLQHFQSMYPELGEHLKKKVTERITDNLAAKEDAPSYHVRQGLSLLLGTELSGELAPQNIQAAQAVFAPPAAQSPGSQPGTPTKKTKGSAPLTNADQAYLTGSQALAKRQQQG